MNSNSGNVMYRKLTAFPDPESTNGIKAATKTIITNIILNVIIRYLNFNENAPIMGDKRRFNASYRDSTRSSDYLQAVRWRILKYKRKIMLRQRCWVSYLTRGIE
jgi:hypothetical protein